MVSIAVIELNAYLADVVDVRQRVLGFVRCSACLEKQDSRERQPGHQACRVLVAPVFPHVRHIQSKIVHLLNFDQIVRESFPM